MRITAGAAALILPLLLVACAEREGVVARHPGAHADLYPLEAVEAPMAVDVPLGRDAARAPDVQRRLESFAQAYADRGRDGNVEVVAARRGDAEEAAAMLAVAGIPRTAVRLRIDAAVAGARAAFVSSAVRVPGCVPRTAADPAADLVASFAEHAANAPHPLMGCATMRNIGVMLADPRDIDAPRVLRPGDGGRAATIVERMRAPKEPAEPTASVKSK